jgi:hypothetical protein
MTDTPSERDMEDLVYISDYGEASLGIQVRYSSKDLDFGERSLERAIQQQIWRIYDIPEVKAEIKKINALYSRGQSWGNPEEQRPQGSEYTRIQREVYELAKGFQAMMNAYWHVENEKKVAKFEALVEKYGSKTDEEILAQWKANKAKEQGDK